MRDLYLFVRDQNSANEMRQFLRRVDKKLEKAVHISYVNSAKNQWRLPVLLTRRQELEGEEAVKRYFINNKQYFRRAGFHVHERR